MTTEKKKIFRGVGEISKISFLTAEMRRTESSLSGMDKKLVKTFAQKMHP
jgi:hypothetical protein